VNLTLSGAKGRVYQIERSRDFVQWEQWRTITNSTANEIISDSIRPPGFFYRAIEQP
jgi:hypothetical protein